MGEYQNRRSVSLAPEEYLLLKKLAEKLDVSQSLIVTALIRLEAKKRRVKVTEDEVEAYKEAMRKRQSKRKKTKKNEAEERAAKHFPGAFK